MTDPPKYWYYQLKDSDDQYIALYEYGQELRKLLREGKLSGLSDKPLKVISDENYRQPNIWVRRSGEKWLHMDWADNDRIKWYTDNGYIITYVYPVGKKLVKNRITKTTPYNKVTIILKNQALRAAAGEKKIQYKIWYYRVPKIESSNVLYWYTALGVPGVEEKLKDMQKKGVITDLTQEYPTEEASMIPHIWVRIKNIDNVIYMDYYTENIIKWYQTFDYAIKDYIFPPEKERQRRNEVRNTPRDNRKLHGKVVYVSETPNPRTLPNLGRLHKVVPRTSFILERRITDLFGQSLDEINKKDLVKLSDFDKKDLGEFLQHIEFINESKSNDYFTNLKKELDEAEKRDVAHAKRNKLIWYRIARWNRWLHIRKTPLTKKILKKQVQDGKIQWVKGQIVENVYLYKREIWNPNLERYLFDEPNWPKNKKAEFKSKFEKRIPNLNELIEAKTNLDIIRGIRSASREKTKIERLQGIEARIFEKIPIESESSDSSSDEEPDGPPLPNIARGKYKPIKGKKNDSKGKSKNEVTSTTSDKLDTIEESVMDIDDCAIDKEIKILWPKFFKEFKKDKGEWAEELNIKFDKGIKKWHKKAMKTISRGKVGYWPNKTFSFLPTYDQLYEIASNPLAESTKTIVNSRDWESVKQIWRKDQNKKEYYDHLKMFDKGEVKRAYVKQLVTLMIELRQKIRQLLLTTEPTEGTIVSNLRSKIMTADTLTADYNTIGRIAKRFGLIDENLKSSSDEGPPSPKNKGDNNKEDDSKKKVEPTTTFEPVVEPPKEMDIKIRKNWKYILEKFEKDIGEWAKQLNIKFDENIMKWHNKAIKTIAYKASKEWLIWTFDFLPTYNDLYEIASNPLAESNKTIVTSRDWESVKSIWQKDPKPVKNVEYVFYVNKLSDKSGQRTYVLQLVALMNELRQKIPQLLKDQTEGTIVSNLRSKIMTADILTADYNMIGRIAKRFGLIE